MRQHQHILEVQTRGTGFTDITAQVNRVVGDSGIGAGLATLFIQHTSASLTIQENADPDVMRDLADHLERLAPRDTSLYRAHPGRAG